VIQGNASGTHAAIAGYEESQMKIIRTTFDKGQPNYEEAK
jgi:hypothetical protein